MQESSPTLVEGLSSKASGPRLDIGSLLDGRYRLLGEIGEGGMGRVYEAYDETLGQMVAVKVMSPKWAGDAKARARFLREVQATQRIHHPNVVAVYGAGFSDTERTRPYLAMERLYGVSLWHYVHCPIQGHGPMELDLAVALMEQAASALEATHQAGVIHRDVKPENFLLTRGPHDEPIIKLLDFGLVQADFAQGRKLTEEGTFVGTPEYMAPELAFGHEASPSTDVYGLASAFYELVTGKMAFSGKTHFEIISQKQKKRAPTLSEGNTERQYPRVLEMVIARALSRSPEKRQKNPRELARQLRAALTAEAPLAGVHGTPKAADADESGPRRRVLAVPRPSPDPEVRAVRPPAESVAPESVLPLYKAGDRRPRRIAIAAVVLLAAAAALVVAQRKGMLRFDAEAATNEEVLATTSERQNTAPERNPAIDFDVKEDEAGVNALPESDSPEPPVPAELAAAASPAEEATALAAAEAEAEATANAEAKREAEARDERRRQARTRRARELRERREREAREARVAQAAQTWAERSASEQDSAPEESGQPAEASADDSDQVSDTEGASDESAHASNEEPVDVGGAIDATLEESALDEVDLERNLL